MLQLFLFVLSSTHKISILNYFIFSPNISSNRIHTQIERKIDQKFISLEDLIENSVEIKYTSFHRREKYEEKAKDKNNEISNVVKLSYFHSSDQTAFSEIILS